MKSLRYTAMASVIALQAAWAPALAAQERLESEAGSAAGQAGAGLSEIIVTAQRRSESLQRAAIAATAMTGEAVANAGVTDASALSRLAPALQINSTFGPTSTFYVRGVGNNVTNILSDPAVSVNIDGVSLGRPSAAQGLFYDLERIEVLKGPQGTLYGRNATGGTINVISHRPDLDTFAGSFNLEYGNYDAVKFDAAANLPLGSNAAFRLAGQLVDRDGYYSDSSGDDNRQSVRGSIKAELGDVDLLLVGDYSHQGGVGPGSTLRGLDRDDMIGLRDPRAGAVYESTFAGSAGLFLNAPNPDLYLDNDFYGFTAELSVPTSIGTIVFQPAHRGSELNFRTFGSGFAITQRETDRQNSAELRLVSDADQLIKYVLGVYYFGESNDVQVNYQQQYRGNWNTLSTDVDSYAAFGGLTFSLTEQFRISLGGRYTIDKKAADILPFSTQALCLDGTTCPGTRSFPDTLDIAPVFFQPDGSYIPVGQFVPYGPGGAVTRITTLTPLYPAATFKKFTYRVGAEYDVGENALLYANYETGFKSGGFFSSIDDPTYQPETIRAITVGFKSRFLDNRVQLNVEAFRWNYKDQQVSQFRVNSVGVPEFITANIGNSRLQGIEVEGRARPTSTTTIGAIVQYLDAKNTRYVYTSPASRPPTTGCALTGPAAGFYTIDCSGFRPSNAPEWTLTANLEQVIPLGELGNLTFNADTRYQSEVYAGFELLPSQLQGGYFTTNLALNYSTPSDDFSIGAFIRNLEDNRVVGYSATHPMASQLIVENLRAPRTYGVRMGAKF